MAIVIDLKMTNAGTTRALDRLEKALDRLDAVLNRINKAIGSAASGADSLANRVQRSTGGGRTSAGSARSSKRPNFATWQDEADWLKKQPGWRAQARAESLRKRMTPKSPAEEMMAVMMRTRFGFSGGKFNAMPLGRDLMGKFGPQLMQMMMGGGGKAGGLLAKMGGTGAAGGLAEGGMKVASVLMRLKSWVAVVIAAFIGLAAATGKLIQYLDNFSRQRTKYGGSPGQLDSAERIARATGASIDSFTGNLSPEVGRAGINPIGGQYGDMNYAEKMRKAAKYVSEAGSFDEARRRAARMGDENLANIYNQDDATKRRLLHPGQGPDTETMTAAARITERLNSWWERLTRTLGRFLTPLVKVTDALTKFIDNVITKVEAFFNMILGWLNMIWGGAFGGGSSPKKTPLDKNTEGLQELTRTMKETREVLGGVQRAQGALPGKLRGDRDYNLKDIRLSNL